MDDAKDTKDTDGSNGPEQPNPWRYLPREYRKNEKHTAYFDGWWYTPEDVALARWQDKEKRAEQTRRMRKPWEESASGRLCLELHQKFMEYKKFLEEHPDVPGAEQGWRIDYPEHVLFSKVLVDFSEYEKARAEKDRRNLQRANKAARCQHTHLDGRGCGAPRIRGQKLCRMHLRMEELQNMKVDLGSLEDPDSIQLAIMKLQRVLLDGTLNPGQVRGLSYLVQLAAWNVMRTTVVRGSQPSHPSPPKADRPGTPTSEKESPLA